jgi:hypothetical protein
MPNPSRSSATTGSHRNQEEVTFERTSALPVNFDVFDKGEPFTIMEDHPLFE